MRTRVEPCMLVSPVLIALSVATTAIVMDYIQPSMMWCWVNPFHNKAGELSWMIIMFVYAPIWVITVIVTVTMIIVYRAVLAQENRMSKYLVKGEQVSRKMSLGVAKQACWYVGSFYITWVVPFVIFIGTRLTMQGEEAEKAYYSFYLTTSILSPLQGFLNSLVYFRPKYVKQQELKRKRKKRETRVTALMTTRASDATARDLTVRASELTASDVKAPDVRASDPVVCE
uniref:G-protein coupled receptors family 1 profile domain-containing protein n=1 Tax=Leptocylindrus danicus TaxID=163516 RepID=A0A7S2PDX1_9STRA